MYRLLDPSDACPKSGETDKECLGEDLHLYLKDSLDYRVLLTPPGETRFLTGEDWKGRQVGGMFALRRGDNYAVFNHVCTDQAEEKISNDGIEGHLFDILDNKDEEEVERFMYAKVRDKTHHDFIGGHHKATRYIDHVEGTCLTKCGESSPTPIPTSASDNTDLEEVPF